MSTTQTAVPDAAILVQRLAEQLEALTKSGASRDGQNSAVNGARKLEVVAWPDSSEELGAPLANWLTNLNLLETANDDLHWYKTTPFDKQAITGGATTVAKVAAPIVGASGLGGVVMTGLNALWATPGTPLQLVLIVCATVLLAVTGIALALIVKADLSARAQSSAAQFAARSACTAAFVRLISPTPHK